MTDSMVTGLKEPYWEDETKECIDSLRLYWKENVKQIDTLENIWKRLCKRLNFSSIDFRLEFDQDSKNLALVLDEHGWRVDVNVDREGKVDCYIEDPHKVFLQSFCNPDTITVEQTVMDMFYMVSVQDELRTYPGDC